MIMEVRVTAATLWSAPTAVRAVDAPALAVPSDTRAWVAGLDHDQRVYDGVLTQLLLGERFAVDEARGGWVRGVALDQPADRLDPRGYPGWLPAVQLSPAPGLGGRQYTLDCLQTTLRDSPHGAVVVADVASGTRLAAAGPARDGWLPMSTPDGPLWVDTVDLVADGPPDVLTFARRLLSTVYVWGGLTVHGIDCSGLVHVAWRRHGVTLPRDADAQFAATVPVPPGEERPGDLYFFARPGKPVHHVGIVAGDRRMVHACYAQRLVVEEPLRGERLATLVSAHRVTR